MKPSTGRLVLATLFLLLTSSMSVLAAGGGKGSYVVSNYPAPVSDRLIVKFKANNLPKGLSVAQINERLSQPLNVQTVVQLQTAAGVALTEIRAIPTGAHVLAFSSRQNRQTLDNAIANIRRVPNIEYVEEDRILKAQAVPNDSYYAKGPTGSPGLWGMWPVTVAATSPAPGGTGSYGADFQTAWNNVTGTGVVVAVVDTGITPNVDIVGPGGAVAAGMGSNLVSTGYDFTSDCRVRGTCPATQTSGTAVAPSPNATDLGDFITSADAASLYFSSNGCTVVSNSSWHGTHVAGTIAALGNNNVGVIGGAYNARILPVRVMGKCGGYISDIANGIMWAAGVSTITNTYPNPNPAKVINLSLGGSCSTPPCTCSITEQTAINAAVAAGAAVVVAAGNDNADVANIDPANCQNVISVAAVGRDGSRASYSNFSSPASNTTNPTFVTLAAQGGDQSSPAFDPWILSTLNTGMTAPVLTGGSNYDYYAGTSMATPHVSATAALMLAKNPALTPAQIKTIISAPSSLTAFPSFVASLAARDCALNNNCGAGILNANLAVQNSAPTVTAPATADFGSVLVNGSVNQAISLTNTWRVPAQAGAATITGPNEALFSIVANACSGMAIASNASCQITVHYAPTTASAHTATLTVPISGAVSGTASPAIVSLTGVAGAPLTTSTPAVTAATVSIGQSTTVDFSYSNPNATAWQVGAVTLSQPAIMAPSVDHCSNTTLAGGASCTVTVTITPATVGTYSGTASLGLSIGGAPSVVTITGNATAASAPASGGGGGGCSIMPAGADPDVSLLLAMLAVCAYRLRRRVVRTQW